MKCYFDHAATTALDPRVFAVMEPYFKERYANPSSIYQFAQAARTAIDTARERTAQILGCAPREVIFTSGGTESNNLFLRGVAEAYEKKGRHLITAKTEHDSVLKTMQYLETRGFEVTYLSVDKEGFVNIEELARALRPDTIAVSIMYANNEIGTIQSLTEIAKVVEKHREKQGGRSALPFFHTDACQAAPYLDLSVKALGVDAMTLNGGKIYGPKGAGVLYIREGIELIPQLHGGGQEHRRRSGTENVPAIVGFAEALALVQASREEETARLIPLRDHLVSGILEKIPESRLNGPGINKSGRLPNNINISFRGLEGEAILFNLDMQGICASAGSACTSGSLEPSHVICSLGQSDEWSHSATRFTLGHGTTLQQVDFVLETLPRLIKELREISPFV